MPNTGKRAEPPTDEEKARIVTGPDPDRFYCPHPGEAMGAPSEGPGAAAAHGCNRSFAELWRLKVHFRAPPDVRGSGKERGHGTELKFCPKCGKDLRPGKHHVGCSAGKSAPRQAAKRQRQQQMSTTTESAQGLTAATTTEHTSSSWEQAVRRQAVKQRLTSEAESTQRSKKAEACRIETLVQNLDAHHVGGPELLFHSNVYPSAQQQQQQPQAHQQQQGHGPLDPVQERLVPVGNGHHHHHQQHHAHQQQHSMLPSLGAVFHQQQQQPQHRNGYGSHGHGGEHAPPAVKLEGSSFV
ncbi:expressed protein [Chlorella variabilis]|uniref:Expressed protein n=1 Tax=Chlorella variabilis TaxID=554065 RepID=E1Z465_CHLVA|nr:expressed protein [Chlorella variabilis]EFN59000.1 expressed protein [Chlorella variabilis]|eukprot:XP_005851102.1 expressed protein [Chlorella variabilis]